MTATNFAVTWVDHKREPQCAPNPDYPDGIDLDCSGNRPLACRAELPYPARRCGHYYVICLLCGANAVITTAGRPDDPRSVKLPCCIGGPSQ